MPVDQNPAQNRHHLQPGDIMHIGMALLWIGCTIYGAATGAAVAAVAWWALAAGYSIGTLAERHVDKEDRDSRRASEEDR